MIFACQVTRQEIKQLSAQMAGVMDFLGVDRAVSAKSEGVPCTVFQLGLFRRHSLGCAVRT